MMIDNNALEHELDAELRNLLLPYLRNREDENQFPKELLSKFIDKYNIFSSCVDSQLDGADCTFSNSYSSDCKVFSSIFYNFIDSSLLWNLPFYAFWNHRPAVSLS